MAFKDRDISEKLQQQLRAAFESGQALNIVAGGSKAFYGNAVDGQEVSVARHQGILSYEPTELVIRARAGTPLSLVVQTLEEHGQMLGFEPAAFGETATLGGTIACNISGPRRAYAGAARDFVLGCRVLNGRAEHLSFGGEVMKNVAGYDVSRLMAGAMGTLGILLDVALKVLPKPHVEQTQLIECDRQEAMAKVHALSLSPLPVSASCYVDNALYLRLSGGEKGVAAAAASLGGETLAKDKDFWVSVQEQQHGFFADRQKNLWRLSLPSSAPQLELQGQWFYDWGGALRWLKSDEPAQRIREQVAAQTGHATLFRKGENSEAPVEVFHPLSPGLVRIHEQLKRAFDPKGILNPGKMYPQL